MLGEVLGWKFDHYPGITTKENLDTGEMEIVEWPDALGARPTPAQVETWTQEYLAKAQFSWRDATPTERLEEIRQRLGIPD